MNSLWSDADLSVAIVGAGMSGLACAHILRDAGCSVHLFDKGRRPGGRASTRSLEIENRRFDFDFGAQYFTARHPDFVAQIAAWSQRGIAARWPALGDEAWVGTPGMSAIIADQAAALDVRWSCHVQAIARRDGRWNLHHREDIEGPFDALVLAIPAEQTTPLAATEDFALARRAAAATSQPCWSLMLAFDMPLPIDRDVLVGDDVIAWAARNSAKPKRSGAEAWIVHATAQWSQAHLEHQAEDVTALLTESFARHAGGALAPIGMRAHRWRYALSNRGGEGAYWNAQLGLGACGDWLLAPRLESAWLSGRMLAGQLLAEPPARRERPLVARHKHAPDIAF